jgi:hypothetical protein
MKHIRSAAGKHCVVEYEHFKFNEEQLAAMDSTRHNIIHGEGITTKVEATDSQEYFFTLTAYACLVVSSKLGLGISYPGFMADYMKFVFEEALKSSAGTSGKSPMETVETPKQMDLAHHKETV